MPRDATRAAPQTPGAPPAPPPGDNDPQDTVEGTEGAQGVDEVAALRAALAEQSAQLAAMQQQLSGALANAKPIPAAVTREADLPDQSEVNPDKIARPTLTKQGWVVPTGYGSPPPAVRTL